MAPKKKTIEFLLKPPLWLCIILWVLCAVCVAGSITLFYVGLAAEDWAIPVHILTALFTVLAVYAVLTVIGIPERAKDNAKVQLFFKSYPTRAYVYATGSIIINGCYVAFGIVISVLTHSPWLVVLVGYHVFLLLPRLLVMFPKYKHKSNEERRELRSYSYSGLMLVMLALAFLPVIRMTLMGQNNYHYLVSTVAYVSAIALYTFIKLGISVYNLKKVKGSENYSLIAVKNVSFADALISLFALQAMMLKEIEPHGAAMKLAERLNPIVGVCISVAICAIGLYMLINGIKRLRALPHDTADDDGLDDSSENAGYVKAVGKELIDGRGKPLRFIGVNLGNWFVQEFWMAASAVGDYETGVYTTVRGERAMKDNELLSDGQIQALYDTYMQNYITENDFREIAALGMNAVRIPFTCYNLANADGSLKADGFKYLDFAVAMCEKYGLYAVLDLHGAFGSQNMDFHSGDDEHFDLYGNPQNREKTIALWKAIAERYKDNRTVAAYDLLNEPRRKKHKFGGRINFDFYDELYKAVRLVDPEHLIMIECFSFPVNGARIKRYGWTNICMEYHIYNLTPFPIGVCNRFYKLLHGLMGYNTPVYIGEWNAFKKPSDWQKSFDFFDKNGWSYTSWTYKTNGYPYKHSVKNKCNWGLYELDIKPVDLSKASYDEIAEVYSRVRTEFAEKTVVYGYWNEHLKKL